MRVATIDVGTNTVLLLVVEQRGAEPVALLDRATITRLGEGVDRTSRLSSNAVQRTVACLREYGRIVKSYQVNRVAVVGTSAMRDAEGGEEVRGAILDSFGVAPTVLSGRAEARLTFLGAMSGLSGFGGDQEAVFDIGGGSTEVIIGCMQNGSPNLSYSASFDVGSVRLTERHVASDPPTPAELSTIQQLLRRTLVGVPPCAPSIPIAVAGTMTTLAAVALRLPRYEGSLVHGHLMAVSELRAVVDHLASLNIQSRQNVTGMTPGRADVIVAGGSIALALLDHWRVDRVRISDRGVRWGVAVELLRTVG